MIVVSDTTPINYLIRLDKFSILGAVFDRIVIPRSVFAELTAPNAPPANHKQLSALPDSFEIRSARHIDLVKGLLDFESTVRELQESNFFVGRGVVEEVLQRWRKWKGDP